MESAVVAFGSHDRALCELMNITCPGQDLVTPNTLTSLIRPALARLRIVYDFGRPPCRRNRTFQRKNHESGLAPVIGNRIANALSAGPQERSRREQCQRHHRQDGKQPTTHRHGLYRVGRSIGHRSKGLDFPDPISTRIKLAPHPNKKLKAAPTVGHPRAAAGPTG